MKNEFYCNYNKEELILKYNGKYFTDKKYYKNNQYSYLCDQNCLFNSFHFNNRILTCNCSMTPLTQITNIETNNECLIKLDKKNIADNNGAYYLIQNSIIQLFSTEKGSDQFIEGFENIIYQITTTENQLDLIKNKSLNKNKVSIIDLSDCEDKLREVYHINQSDSLIILKYENVSNNIKTSEKNVQFDVFNSLY